MPRDTTRSRLSATRSFDLTDFSLRDMTDCGAGLRACGPAATSLQDAAQRIVQYLYGRLRDRGTGVEQCALVRCFATCRFSDLDAADRESAQAALGRAPRAPGMKCFTLLGTAGMQPGWNDRLNSRRYRAIPLISEQFVGRFPMFAQLLKQFGIKIQPQLRPESDLLMDWEERTHNVFYVPDAVDSPFVPVQREFVLRYGVKSTLGFGGLLPSGNLFAVILFAKVRIPSETADHFRTLALSAKLALLPHDRERDVDPPQPTRRGGAPARRPFEADLAKLRTEASTLGQLLAVHERTVVADVIHRDLAESRLDQLRREYELLLTSVKDGIYGVDLDGNTSFVNPAGARMLGWTGEELTGRPMHALVHYCKADRSPYPSDECPVYQTLRDGTVHDVDDEVFWRKDGTSFHVEYSSTPLVEGEKIVGAVVIFRDITERKQAAAALRQAEEQYHSIVENAVEGIFQTTPDGRFLAANPALARMCGYDSPRDLVQSVTDVGAQLYVDPADRAAFKRVVEQEGMVRGFEYQMYRKDRTRFWVSEHARAVRDAQGRVVCYEGTIEDITMRREVQVELQATLGRVRTLSKRLETVREEERTRIARELHDELGVGLTCLKIDLSRVHSLVETGASAKDRGKLAEKLRSMTEQVDATITAVQRIVAELRPGVLDDLGLVAAIEWQCRDFQRRTGIPCACEVSAEDIVMAPERATAVFRICQEALTNVARHAGATAVSVRLQHQDDRLLLEVRDNGRGIPADRLSDSKSFGLMGMFERVRDLQGDLQISGSPGAGTTITVNMNIEARA